MEIVDVVSTSTSHSCLHYLVTLNQDNSRVIAAISGQRQYVVFDSLVPSERPKQSAPIICSSQSSKWALRASSILSLASWYNQQPIRVQNSAKDFIQQCHIKNMYLQNNRKVCYSQKYYLSCWIMPFLINEQAQIYVVQSLGVLCDCWIGRLFQFRILCL